MEDINTGLQNGKSQYRVSARMILKKSTLLKWIEIIEEEGRKEKAFEHEPIDEKEKVTK